MTAAPRIAPEDLLNAVTIAVVTAGFPATAAAYRWAREVSDRDDGDTEWIPQLQPQAHAAEAGAVATAPAAAITWSAGVPSEGSTAQPQSGPHPPSAPIVSITGGVLGPDVSAQPQSEPQPTDARTVSTTAGSGRARSRVASSARISAERRCTACASRTASPSSRALKPASSAAARCDSRSAREFAATAAPTRTSSVARPDGSPRLAGDSAVWPRTRRPSALSWLDALRRTNSASSIALSRSA